MEPKLNMAIPSIAGFMLIGAVFEFDYSYYILLRWVVSIAAIYVAYVGLKHDKLWVTLSFGFIGILFNPIAPVHLDRESWMPIDLALGAIFLLGTDRIFNKNEFDGR